MGYSSLPVPANHFPRFSVDTVGFSRINRSNLIVSLESFFTEESNANYICVSNVHTTVECRHDERLRRIQNGSFLTIADGQPVIWYGRISGEKGVERIMGPDIMTMVFEASECRNRRHFFLGGTPETLARMEKNLRAKYPYLQIAGQLSPPFRKMQLEEETAMRLEILSTKPDYLWICFGAPKQEYWMEMNHRHFPNSLLLGIGAGFAYHAGELQRAPVWAQKLACEWVWRMAQDPKRLWKRYAKTNPIFLGMLLKRAALRCVGL